MPELRYSSLLEPKAARHSSGAAEVRVGVRRNEELFEKCLEIVLSAIKAPDFRLRISAITSLHAVLFPESGGLLRPADVKIEGSRFSAPPANDLPDLLADMCDYVNVRFARGRPLSKSEAIHVSAFALWRLNWIHPFFDGNGAIARALCYLLLSIGLDSLLPGVPTIPEQIAEVRPSFYSALEQADAAWREGIVDTSTLEAMIDRMLGKQLSGT